MTDLLAGASIAGSRLVISTLASVWLFVSLSALPVELQQFDLHKSELSNPAELIMGSAVTLILLVSLRWKAARGLAIVLSALLILGLNFIYIAQEALDPAKTIQFAALLAVPILLLKPVFSIPVSGALLVALWWKLKISEVLESSLLGPLSFAICCGFLFCCAVALLRTRFVKMEKAIMERQDTESTLTELALSNEDRQQLRMDLHELRTPVATVQLILEALDEGRSLATSKVPQQIIKGINNNINQLGALLTNEQISHQKGFRRALSVKELLTKAVENFNAHQPTGQPPIKIEQDDNSTALHLTNAARLELTITLMCRYIAAHSESQHQPVLSIAAKASGSDSTQFEISIHTIPQIDKSSLVEKLLRRFFWGFWIVRDSVDSKGNDLSTLSYLMPEGVFEAGSDFVDGPAVKLTLTLVNAADNVEERGKKTDQPLQYPLEGRKILLVEDTQLLRKLGSKQLEARGARVVGAQNGIDALNQLKNEFFDLVITDLQMPVMGGLELVAEIRRLGITLPVIALTGFGIGPEVDQFLEAGGDDALTKPLDPDQLEAILSAHAGSSTSETASANLSMPITS